MFRVQASDSCFRFPLKIRVSVFSAHPIANVFRFRGALHPGRSILSHCWSKHTIAAEAQGCSYSQMREKYLRGTHLDSCCLCDRPSAAIVPEGFKNSRLCEA